MRLKMIKIIATVITMVYSTMYKPMYHVLHRYYTQIKRGSPNVDTSTETELALITNQQLTTNHNIYNYHNKPTPISI